MTGKPSTFAPSSHIHDDRYYTESEIDSKLSGKANSSHTHSYLPLSGGTLTGTLAISNGADLEFRPPSSNDTGDIVFFYANGNEKLRI